MPDSDDIITALKLHWGQIGRALGTEAGQAFLAEYGPLNRAVRDAATSAQQEQATADLIALLQRYPLVLQVLAQSDPAMFGALGAAAPPVSPLVIAPADPPPVPPLPEATLPASAAGVAPP
ncbi:MAG: hypothetical protein M3Z04_17850, partial [Chloroflexota bacterium]|nr:hypothetical protein [Chloroflexota bacterium]